jgi:hypothetical protein
VGPQAVSACQQTGTIVPCVKFRVIPMTPPSMQAPKYVPEYSSIFCFGLTTLLTLSTVAVAVGAIVVCSWPSRLLTDVFEGIL